MNLLQILIHNKNQSKVNSIIIQNNISSLVSSRSLKESYQKLYGINEEIINKLSENQIGMIYLNRLLVKFEMLMDKKCGETYENFGNKEIANEEEKMKMMKELSEEFEKMKEDVVLTGESRYYYYCCLNYLYSFVDVNKIDESNLRMISNVKECEIDENNLLLESRRLNKNENVFFIYIIICFSYCLYRS